MAERYTAGGIGIQLDSRDWYELTRRLKLFDPELVKALRRRLRGVGSYAVESIRHELGLPSPDAGADTHKYRDMLAAATKVSISFSSRQAGLKVRTGNQSLPTEHQPIMKAYNLGSFRHPVFGDTDTWVTQKGRPYFGQDFQDAVFARARLEAERAIADANATLERLQRS